MKQTRPFARALRTILPIFVAVAAATSAAGFDVPRVAPPGSIGIGPDGHSVAERLRIEPGILDTLLSLPVEASLYVPDWPVAPGIRSGVRLARHDVYRGALSTLRSSGVSWAARYCNSDNSGALSFDPTSTTDFYFVVVGNNGTQEGSYGKNSSGTELPAAGAGGGCSYTQVLGGVCP